MPAESRRAAVLDGAHHFQLGEAHMAGVGRTPHGTEVRDFYAGQAFDIIGVP
jgi:hypothetical protein